MLKKLHFFQKQKLSPLKAILSFGDGIAFLLLPIAVALLVGAAYLVMNTIEDSFASESVEFKTYIAREVDLAPIAVSNSVAKLNTSSKKYDTQRSEVPIWIVLGKDQTWQRFGILEFPSKHTQNISCWTKEDKASPILFVGEASRISVSRGLFNSRSGFGIDHSKMPIGTELLCRSRFVGPAKITARLWNTQQYFAAEKAFNRSGGFLYGGMVMLALMCASIAVLNRDKLFAVFAIWMLFSLRIASFGGGWDFSWLSIAVSSEMTTLIKKISVSLYAYLSIQLFAELFKDELRSSKLSRAVPIFSSLALIQTVLGVVIPYKYFVQMNWLLSGSLTIYLAIASTILWTLHRSIKTATYALSWVVFALCAAAEIVRAATGGVFADQFNLVSGAIFGSALSAIALADKMREDRSARVKADTNARFALQRFRENYNSVPVGLATIDLHGDVLHFNPSFKAMFNVTQASSKHSINRHFAPAVFAEIKERLKTTTETSLRVTPKDTAPGDRAFSIQASIRDNLIEASIQEITKEYEAEIRLNLKKAVTQRV